MSKVTFAKPKKATLILKTGWKLSFHDIEWVEIWGNPEILSLYSTHGDLPVDYRVSVVDSVVWEDE